MNRSSEPVHPAQGRSGLLHSGITLREHLAGLAMQGLLARDAHHDPVGTAELATRCADALLAELAGEAEGQR